ncbi:MAG: hypothetical protein U0894_03215 [Pirellulales bacterium]
MPSPGRDHRVLPHPFDEANIRAIIREDRFIIRKKHGEDRMTEISGEELVRRPGRPHPRDDVVSISHGGATSSAIPVQHLPFTAAALRGPMVSTEDEDPTQEHLFAASTHAYLGCLRTWGRSTGKRSTISPNSTSAVPWPAIVNLLNLAEGEKIAECLAIRDQQGGTSDDGHPQGTHQEKPARRLQQAQRGGAPRCISNLVKMSQRPMPSSPSSAMKSSQVLKGMAIRFSESDARPMGRNDFSVKGISLLSATSRRHGRYRSRSHHAHRLRKGLWQADLLRPRNASCLEVVPHLPMTKTAMAAQKLATLLPKQAMPQKEPQKVPEDEEGDESTSGTGVTARSVVVVGSVRDIKQPPATAASLAGLLCGRWRRGADDDGSWKDPADRRQGDQHDWP